MNKTTILIICALAIIIPSITKRILSSCINKKALFYLHEHNYEDFYKLLDSFISKFVFYPFNLEYFKLNGAFMQENDSLINSQIELIDSKLKLNKEQKTDFYYKAFAYYLSKENKTKTNYFLNKIKTLKNDNLTNTANILNDVYINKGNKYLDSLLQDIKKDISKEELISKQTLIMQIYENMGDIKTANKYKKAIKEFYNN